ncbi:bifunctional 5-dehydro-2-deoxygluconokinase/5-dehydro-2-deoxyphosphogluconate aldolase [Variovorax guangxiensis]|uniref:5-dehydro-2-deoxygluconokinase n=1 Tax=Variovorax guangxiensis TaxID=1775474 RepID=A0A502DCV7_9BURK|nr:5-dehydro-2-deoxygluconokinase [Variovorax guangxiensis]TPG23497.1 5-dehydro-2-deoxygluconokinase [Variovorax guangxiensis]TPG24044.1 5-dehydro-2-deoxygluconokinase [Variovorax ginsengisoli]
MTSSRSLDLITIGRAIVDIYGDQVGARLEDVSSFSRYVGGCPANIAIGTSRLGLKVGMVTRVGDDHNGRYLKETLSREGVDTRHVVADSARLTGVAFLAIRDKETFPLLHYRENCADMAISPEDYSEDYIASARALLVSGSHLTTEAAAENLRVAIARAKARGTQVIFDIDYRPVFWGLVGRDVGESRFVDSAVVTRACQRHMAEFDLIVGTEEEVHIAGGDIDTIKALRRIRALTQAPIVLKRGAAGCVVFPEAIPDILDDGIVGPGFPVEVFNVVGAGDGFLSGFLSGWLRDKSWEDCCRSGNATGALVVSRHGCSPASPTAVELAWFLDGGRNDPALHRSEHLRYLHRTTTRRPRASPVFVMAADHVAPFESLPRVEGRTLAGLKSLIADVALQLAPRHPGMGVLFDDAQGEQALFRVGSDIAWVGRKIERTGPAPLRFTDDLPAAVLLASWPRHQIVKCLVPMEDESTQALQEERLLELYRATSMYGMELLLEFVHPDTPDDAEVVVERIHRTQALGVLPDWWKLPAFSGPACWDAIERAIRLDNPMCRGVLLLGGGRAREDLLQALSHAPRPPFIQGFAVGRTLFMEPAAAWLAGECDDAGFAADLSAAYEQLAVAWRDGAGGPADSDPARP